MATSGPGKDSNSAHRVCSAARFINEFLAHVLEDTALCSRIKSSSSSWHVGDEMPHVRADVFLGGDQSGTANNVLWRPNSCPTVVHRGLIRHGVVGFHLHWIVVGWRPIGAEDLCSVGAWPILHATFKSTVDTIPSATLLVDVQKGAPSAWCGRWLPATLGWSPSDPHPSYQRCRRERRESRECQYLPGCRHRHFRIASRHGEGAIQRPKSSNPRPRPVRGSTLWHW